METKDKVIDGSLWRLFVSEGADKKTLGLDTDSMHPQNKILFSPESSFDSIVLKGYKHSLKDSVISESYRILKQGAEISILSKNGFPFFSLYCLRKRLERCGFNKIDSYWIYPNFKKVAWIIPMDNKPLFCRTLDFVLWITVNKKMFLKRWLIKMLIWLNIFQYLVPCYQVIAVKK